MKPKFEPDVDSEVKLPPAARLIDPDAYDASEQRFAASVEEKSAPPRFVLDAVEASSSNSTDGGSEPDADGEGTTEGKPGTVAPAPSLPAEFLGPPESGAWRGEVAARVHNYRARRRPRAPRYPSLQLKFDPPQPVWAPQAATSAPAATTISSQLAVAMQDTISVPRK